MVEADASMRQVITDALEEAGFAVQTVGGTSEALEVLGRQPPRAILVDLSRPSAEGWAFLVRCRHQPRCRTLPIWLPKPFERDQLVRLMDDLTRPRPAQRPGAGALTPALAVSFRHPA